MYRSSAKPEGREPKGDLLASKLMAGREKDFEFLRALFDRALGDFPTLLARMDLLRAGASGKAVPDRLTRLARHLRDWGRDDLARTVRPQLDSNSHFDGAPACSRLWT